MLNEMRRKYTVDDFNAVIETIKEQASDDDDDEEEEEEDVHLLLFGLVSIAYMRTRFC